MEPLLRSLALTALVFLVFALLAPVAHAQFTYTFYPDDATINSDVTTNFAIVGYASGSYDDNFNPNFVSPSSPTIQLINDVNVGEDLDFGEIDVFNQSIVNIRGGNITPFIVAYDNSTINVSGGSTDFILGTTNSVINMSGGSVGDLEGQNKGINVTGGTIGTLVANTQTDFFGNALGGCIVDVTGGSVGIVDVFNAGIVNLRGGSISTNVVAAFGGTANFFGNNLTAVLLDPNVNNRFSRYQVSGTLADGTSLNNTDLFVENDGVTYGHSSFNLISSSAPEPNSLLLAACGTLFAGGLLVRRRKMCPLDDASTMRSDPVACSRCQRLG